MKEIRPARKRSALSAVAYLLSLAMASASYAQPMERYVLTSWAHRDGLPSTLIYAIAQTRDGYLWLGTSDGLVRSDGITFDHQRLIVNSELMLGTVTALRGATDGSLWIGSASGAVTQMLGARLRICALGYPIEAIVEPAPGDIWVFSSGGMYRFAKAGQGALAPAESIASAKILAQLQTGGAALLLGKGITLKNANELSQTPTVYSQRIMIGGRSFLVNEVTNGGVLLTVDASQKEQGRAVVLRDGRGDLWAGNSSGLIRTSSEGASPIPELASRQIESLLEDREGNVWVGSNNGLYRFRYGRVFSLTARDGLTDDGVSSVAADTTAVWVGTQSGLDRIDSLGVRKFLSRVNVLSVRAARNHQIWAGTHTGVFRINKAGAELKAERVVPQLSSVTTIEEDTEGSLWLLDSQRGLYRWRDGFLNSVASKPDFQPGSISFLRAQSDGTVWIGFSTGGISVYRDNSFYEPSFLSGTATGTVYDAFMESPNLIWLATDTGLYRFSGNTSRHWNAKNGLPGNRVLWLRPQAGRWLWLGFSTGIARVRRPDLLSGSDFFDFEDGLLANPVRRSQAAAIVDEQGKLWLTTSAGLAIIDAPHLTKNNVPPKVLIERVFADNREVPRSSSLRFPALTRNVEIDYNGLSLTEPRKLRFRYQLVGYDKQLQEAGSRRQAFYTNLPPGTYQFHVLAANGDGVWSEMAASLGFTLEPAFLQTEAFKVLCFAAAVLVAVGLYRLRTRSLRAAWNARLETRLAERTRIAQELHDDLLQSAMGVSLQIELVDSLVENPPLAKAHLQRALSLSRALMQKGRQVLRDLREETRETSDIATVLSASIQEGQQEGGPVATLSVEGTARVLDPLVADDLAQIGCQALLNAFQHAGAKRIDVHLNYKAAELNLEVNDDGCGMSQGIVESGKPGHYGLVGMRERAQRIGGTLTIASVAGQGTRLTASVPGRRAYRGVKHDD